MTKRSPQVTTQASLTVVTITPAALASIKRIASSAPAGIETGGILLGHERFTRLDITIAGDPGPNAIHSPTFFQRDREHAQGLADLAYDEKGAAWLGEWHTHPIGPLIPSPRDLLTYRQLIANSELALEVLVALIGVPTEPEREGPRATHPTARAGPGLMLQAWVIDSQNTAAAKLHVV